MQDELLREIDCAEIALVRCYRRAIEHVNANEDGMYDWDLADMDFTAPFLLARGFVTLELCRELAGGCSLSGMAAQCGNVLEAVLCGEVSAAKGGENTGDAGGVPSGGQG